MALLTQAEELNGSRRLALKDLATALSLANLCFLPIWAALMYQRTEAEFLSKTLPTHVQSFVTELNVLLMTAVVWVAIKATRFRGGRWTRPVGLGVLILVTLLAANAVRTVWQIPSSRSIRRLNLRPSRWG